MVRSHCGGSSQGTNHPKLRVNGSVRSIVKAFKPLSALGCLGAKLSLRLDPTWESLAHMASNCERTTAKQGQTGLFAVSCNIKRVSSTFLSAFNSGFLSVKSDPPTGMQHKCRSYLRITRKRQAYFRSFRQNTEINCRCRKNNSTFTS